MSSENRSMIRWALESAVPPLEYHDLLVLRDMQVFKAPSYPIVLLDIDCGNAPLSSRRLDELEVGIR